VDAEGDHAGVKGGRGGDEGGRPVGRAVVDDHDLEARIALAGERGQAGGQAPLLVTGGDEDGHERGSRGGRSVGHPRKPGHAPEDGDDAEGSPEGTGEGGRGQETLARRHGRVGYRPWNRGRRFSRKAAVPSR